VGEALVSFLDEKGRPGVTERVYVLPPASQIGPISPEQRTTLLTESIVAGVYEKTLDRDSAFEKLKGRAEAKSAEPADKGHGTAAAPEGGGLLDSLGSSLGSIFGGGNGRRTSAGEQMVKSAASAIGREVGRQVLRGVLGGIFGGRR
jgi:hypothetical protein